MLTRSQLLLPLKMALLLSLELGTVSPERASACGLEWGAPTRIFDSVDRDGCVDYWEKIDEVSLGEDLILPLYINFSSARKASSPYLGYGWMLPLFESIIIQPDLDRFAVIEPTGRVRSFTRDQNDRRMLHGQTGWEAVIDEQTVTAWAPCGWKLVFNDMRLARITTPADRNIEFKYVNGRLSEIVEHEQLVLSISPKAADPDPTVVSFNGKNLEFTLAERPLARAEEQSHQNALSELSLSRWSTAPAGAFHAFDFSLDEAGHAVCQIVSSATSARVFVWEQSNGGRIIADGQWKYVIQSSAGGGAFAIERRAGANEFQYWRVDRASGLEVSGSNEASRTLTYHTSGPLQGRLHQIVDHDYASGKSTLKYEASFSPDGTLNGENIDGHQQSYGERWIKELAKPTEIKAEAAPSGSRKVELNRDGQTLSTLTIGPTGIIQSFSPSPGVKE